MSMRKRVQERQEAWIATTELPRSPGHPFYRKLNELLAEAGFDRWVEAQCEAHYAEELGRPSIPPGVYFRMIFSGYFEGIASQRGIAWRCSDSLSLREFLGLSATEATPDHSSLTRVHQRLPLEVHEEVFRFMLKIATAKKLVKGKTVAVDSTTLEANAAMKSIVRKDTGEDWEEYLKRLAAAAGIENPTAEELRRFDQQRKDKKVSNDEWMSPSDPDSRITKMKDKTTHLAYKAEHVVDVDTDLVLAATVHGGTAGDTQTLVDSVKEAQENLDAAHEVRRASEAVAPVESPLKIEEVAADKGYYADGTLAACTALGLRTYILELQRGRGPRRKWTNKPAEYRQAVYANRQRVRRDKSKRLQRKRSEFIERSFAHVCETGGARRCWLRGLLKVTKRYLLQVAARNLGVMLRKLFGIGTPRSLQGAGALLCTLSLALRRWGTPQSAVGLARALHRSTITATACRLRFAA